MALTPDTVKKDKRHVVVVSVASCLVIAALLAGVLAGERIPGGPPAAIMAAFFVVFATIAWATVRGIDDDTRGDNK
jgi:4-hydroxybenzoate polyprenyltransferase